MKRKKKNCQVRNFQKPPNSVPTLPTGLVLFTFFTMIDFPFIDFPYVDAWLSACSVIGDVRTAAWVIDAAARNKSLVHVPCLKRAPLKLPPSLSRA